MYLRRLIFAFTLGYLLLASIDAQTPAKQQEAASTQEKLEARKELEEKAFALLEEVIVQSSTLRQVDNRITIQASAADLIWKRDEKRARALFKAASASLAEVMATMDQSDPQYGS